MQPDPEASYADQVRAFCRDRYVEPARRRADYSVSIRAGDVHKELKLKNRLPLVCAALGATTFEQSLNLTRVSIYGPLNGSSTLFTFLIREKIAAL